jgi:hypothetical protein
VPHRVMKAIAEKKETHERLRDGPKLSGPSIGPPPSLAAASPPRKPADLQQVR